MSKYRYYLANGECIEYSLSSNSILFEVIVDIVYHHYDIAHDYVQEIVYVQPEIFSTLIKEHNLSLAASSLSSTTPNTIKLFTSCGLVNIIPKFDLEFPIFFGSEQELKDNEFNTFMEKILCE